MLSYVLPTRNRPDRLQRTLHALGRLDAAAHARIGGGEVIVVDNNSDSRPDLPKTLANGLPLRAVFLDQNIGAAARNRGVDVAGGDWIVMLDDDSHPLDSSHIELLLNAPDDVAAIGAEITLPDGSRERGGLPEVIIGCGAAIRREAFLHVGGYDPTFDYYVEEYDLCAKLLMEGWRVMQNFGGQFRVLHEKVTAGRDFNVIIRRLVRNNVWVMQRYAPESVRQCEIAQTIKRYAGIAMKEQAARGFAEGMADLASTLATQMCTPMSEELWNRFTGASAVCESLSGIDSGKTVCIIEAGKNVEVIRREVINAGGELIEDERIADVLMIGTLSPGPMLDAFERRMADPRTRTPVEVQGASQRPKPARASHFSGPTLITASRSS